MTCHRVVLGMAAAWALFACGPCRATEGASGLYPLGGQALNAGVTPPPGWYVTVAPLYYRGSVGGALQGGVTVLSLHKEVRSLGTSLLYAPKRKLFGAQVALSAAVPYAHLDLGGEIGGARSLRREVSGSGVGDMALGGRLGWKIRPRLFRRGDADRVSADGRLPERLHALNRPSPLGG